MTIVPVKTNTAAYNIHIGTGLMDTAGQLLRQVTKGDSIMLVCGDIVHGLHAPRVKAALEREGYTVREFVYPHGEQSKTPETYLALLSAMAEAGLTRSDTVVALGGGVTGDLAGFAAATYQRGIAYVQMPTTLLAAVDSSVGGKTAIDLPAGKNLVGAFHHPKLVLCDLDALATLPEDVYTDGMGEVIKYGMIWDAGLADALTEDLEAVIARCVTIKAQVVGADEFDTGLRGILNFGHTVGHAIEKCSDFTVSHGRAVAIGMAVVTRAAVLAGQCDEAVYTRLVQVLTAHRLPTATDMNPEALLKAMYADKKRAGAAITLVVPTAPGKVELQKMTMEAMEQFLKTAMR